MSREQQGSQCRKNKMLIADRRDKMVGKSGDESREEKSVPRFAGCDGGANKSGLSHVDFEAKATRQSAESARKHCKSAVTVTVMEN